MRGNRAAGGRGVLVLLFFSRDFRAFSFFLYFILICFILFSFI